EYYRSRSGQGLGRGLQVVRYDARGGGLSDRHHIDFSMGARMLDLEAVVERLQFTRFAIFGRLHGTPTAIAYAARHPERVSHLILANAHARGRDPREMGRDWESLSATFSLSGIGIRAGSPTSGCRSAPPSSGTIVAER